MLDTATAQEDDILQSAKTVRHRLGGISEMTLWRRVQDGTLPVPIKVGRLNYWRRSDVDAVISGGLRPGAASAPEKAAA